jgi:hypothetical protein
MKQCANINVFEGVYGKLLPLVTSELKFMARICAYYMDISCSALAPKCEFSEAYLLPSIPNFRHGIIQNNTFKSSAYDNLQHQAELGLHQVKLNSYHRAEWH